MAVRTTLQWSNTMRHSTTAVSSLNCWNASDNSVVWLKYFKRAKKDEELDLRSWLEVLTGVGVVVLLLKWVQLFQLSIEILHCLITHRDCFLAAGGEAFAVAEWVNKEWSVCSNSSGLDFAHSWIRWFRILPQNTTPQSKQSPDGCVQSNLHPNILLCYLGMFSFEHSEKVKRSSKSPRRWSSCSLFDSMAGSYSTSLLWRILIGRVQWCQLCPIGRREGAERFADWLLHHCLFERWILLNNLPLADLIGT